jgi:hypothetical protein
VNAPTAEGSVCRVRLRFNSLVGLSALIGFSAGVVGIPIVLALQADKIFSDGFWIMSVLFTVIAAPLVGAINGVISGVLGFPLYRWITRRINVHTYSGEFTLFL